MDAKEAKRLSTQNASSRIAIWLCKVRQKIKKAVKRGKLCIRVKDKAKWLPKIRYEEQVKALELFRSEGYEVGWWKQVIKPSCFEIRWDGNRSSNKKNGNG